jgi:hypothetical protein
MKLTTNCNDKVFKINNCSKNRSPDHAQPALRRAEVITRLHIHRETHHEVKLFDGPRSPCGQVAELIAKIRRALCIKHIEDATSGWRIADHNAVRGVIEWDDAQDGKIPFHNGCGV